MTDSPLRIAVVGSTMIDLVAYTPRVPGPGETIVGDRFQMGFGGKGANQAVMARNFGAAVWMVNCVGDDAYGTMARDNLSARGVDTTFVHQVPGSSGVAPIWVEPDGTNRIIIVPGANHALTAEQAVAAIEAIRPEIVIGQFEIPQQVTAAAFVTARAGGAVTILNPAPAAPIDPALLAACDWVTPNEVEFELLFGRTDGDDSLIEVAATLGCRLVVTLGAAGCALVDEEVVRRIPADSVTAVDTTGAGDAFVGTFAFGLGIGLHDREAALLANRSAAVSVTRPGTQTSFPSAEEAAQLLEALPR